MLARYVWRNSSPEGKKPFSLDKQGRDMRESDIPAQSL